MSNTAYTLIPLGLKSFYRIAGFFWTRLKQQMRRVDLNGLDVRAYS